jgi:hypothetical protein
LPRPDRIFPPRFVKLLAAGISGSRYVELDGAHGVTIQRSADVNQFLREHFTEATGLAAATSFTETG